MIVVLNTAAPPRTLKTNQEYRKISELQEAKMNSNS